MDKNILHNAMNEIGDRHLAEAATYKKRKYLPWLGAIAAVLAVVLVLNFVKSPMAIRAEALSLAGESRAMERPDRTRYPDPDQWYEELRVWSAQNEQRSGVCSSSLNGMQSFLTDTCREFLSGGEENLLYSPINTYIGLALAAEMTASSTRGQLLRLLGVENVEALRTQVSAMWESVYRDNGKEISTLANSIWLDSSLHPRQEVMDVLAYHYYCSAYRQALSGKQAARDIAAWLNNNTGGFLKQYTDGYALPEETVLALYSTIYFQSKWDDEFRATNNTQAVFHAPGRDYECTFMNAKLRQMDYYWGESFGAVSLGLKNGSRMWLILPDPGKTPADVLAQGDYMRMVTGGYNQWEDRQYSKVNLSLPKFDISAQTKLKDGLRNLGVTDLFDMDKADFSVSLAEPAFITAVNQSVRVAVDETGVRAAAYIELEGAGAAAPPEEIVDFVLDRPFLFVITNQDRIPLFAGVVNEP